MCGLVFGLVLSFTLSSYSGIKIGTCTPVHVYYDPLFTLLESSGDLSPAVNWPNFLNYPVDLAKYGLRGNVSVVRYIVRTFEKDTTGIGLAFDEAGKLIMTHVGSFVHIGDAEIRELRYDRSGKLTGIVENPHRDRQASNKECFEYDASNRLVKRSSPFILGEWQTYTYYPNGSQKRMIPVQNLTNFSSLGWVGTMEFNETGELIRMESQITANPFVFPAKNYRNELHSVCTFIHSEGLCTEKQETIFFKDEGMKPDTISCLSRYAYNGKGDIASWEYDGGYFHAKFTDSFDYTISRISFTIRFDYDYDCQGNWTTMRIILPDNYADIMVLRNLYSSLAKERESRSGVKPVVIIERNIDYY